MAAKFHSGWLRGLSDAARSGLRRFPHSLLPLFCLGLVQPAAAQPLEVKLVSEVRSIQPGVPFYVGLHLHHGPGYHTYWRFPGVVGVPTGIEWRLPKGFKAGPIEWPEPERVLMFQIKAQGFERDVLLPVRITPPADLKAGQTIRLEGKSSWMSCAQTCHPGFTDVVLELPVKAEPAPFDERWRPQFEAERSRFPQASDAWTAAAHEKDQVVTLTLTPASPAARMLTTQSDAAGIIFFTDDGWINSDKPQVVKLREDGSLIFTLIVSDVYLKDAPPTTLAGIVQNPGGWLVDGKLRSLQINPPLRRQPGGRP